MKNKFLILSCVTLIATANAVAAKKGHGGKIASVGATVTGYVDLQAKTTRNFPNDLVDIYKGDGTSITLGKKGKRINVTGNYVAGSDVVRVQEDKDVASSVAKYRFDLPVPAKISGFSSGTFSTKNTMATLYFASLDELEDNGLGDDDIGNDNGGNNSLVKMFKKKFVKAKKPKSPIKKFKTKLHKLALQKFLAGKTASVSDFGAVVSVKKVTAVRSGNKGTVSGSFVRTGSPAKGRFKLNMTFDE